MQVSRVWRKRIGVHPYCNKWFPGLVVGHWVWCLDAALMMHQQIQIGLVAYGLVEMLETFILHGNTNTSSSCDLGGACAPIVKH